ncbi:MFS transporter [Dictyobacter vulcani]|uniref:MFS transporter n=1 Tax=Dictyobacter vulcani TaxID=2607529 RepID=A0A5J4KSC8_9CHLR|nr:MFS transporter [Dictyobacter vulcani]GER90573.1 MFS transporter [Dictyobacter vulcani]
MSKQMTAAETVKTDIPARMDRLPWSRWHWLVIIALGITWILDGLEVTIVGSIASVLKEPQTLHLTDVQVTGAGTTYLIGAVIGALFFGRLTDKWGRKKLFMLTLALYLIATIATAFSFNIYWFIACRFITGAGIGGEYSAINSAVDELIPARARGWTDIMINSTWWVGTAVGAALTGVLLSPAIFPINLGWRLAFGLGAILGLAILLVRRFVPESPRWLMMHGRFDEADQVVKGIEEKIMKEDKLDKLPDPEGTLEIRPQGTVTFTQIARTMFRDYPKRSLLGFSLMVGQAFLYNAITFSYGLIFTTFMKVSPNVVAFYLIPFALGNILGPLTIGRLFDTIGRRKMISFTYICSGVLFAVTGWLFALGILNAITLTICWCIVFFFASSGASSAYLTVSEVFPLETRAMAIAFFYAIGTAIGGALTPIFFGYLIQTGNPYMVFYGYILGAVLMVGAGIVAIFFGIDAEGKSLEKIARPLSASKQENTAASETAL